MAAARCEAAVAGGPLLSARVARLRGDDRGADRHEREADEDARSGEAGEAGCRRPLAPPPGGGRGEDDRGQEEQPHDEVEGDDPAGQLEPDDDGAEQRLQRDEDDGEQRRPEDVRARAVAAPGPDRHRDGEHADERDDRAVAVLDHRRPLVERDSSRRAERPVRAAETRLGHADDAADRDERPGRKRGRGRKEAEAETRQEDDCRPRQPAAGSAVPRTSAAAKYRSEPRAALSEQ